MPPWIRHCVLAPPASKLFPLSAIRVSKFAARLCTKRAVLTSTQRYVPAASLIIGMPLVPQIPDEYHEFYKLDLDEDSYLPAIFLHYSDDLTEL